MIEIRAAQPSDAPAMARVIVDTWFAVHKEHVSKQTLERRRQTWGYKESEQGWRRSIHEADQREQVLVAIDTDRVIAVAGSEMTVDYCAEVGALYVEVQYQRLGVGRRLLEHLIDLYKNRHVPKLHIAVLATNQPARRFYERMGGREVGTRDDPDGLEIVYAWDLSAREG